MPDSTSAKATRADQLTALLADAPKPDDHDGVRDYLRSLAAAGCAPLLIYPNTKAPADPRTPQRRAADDKAARQAARDAGRPWQRIKSPAGVHLATDDAAVLDRYLTQYATTFGGAVAVNVAVSVGRSRLVVVDCDTAEQGAAFLTDAGAPEDTAPSVRTPGAQDADGAWIHSDGGHYWFTVPEGVELPEGAAEYTDPEGGYSVFWGPGRYVLTPPSVRAEGAYTVPDGGAVHPLPDWLAQRIIERARVAPRVADRSRDSALAVPIDEWSRAVAWAEILEPLGWTPTGRADACGCETWTAPGEHASPKSATAHEPGCAEPRYDTDNPPLHIWTDNPGEPFASYVTDRGTATLSKLQAVALLDFDNDMGAAMTELNLHGEPVTLGASGEDDRRDDRDAGRRGLRITWASEIEPEPVPWLWVDISSHNMWTPGSPPGTAPDPYTIDDIACVAPGHSWRPPEVETDGRIACGMVSIAAGREGSGKSSFGIWLTAKITCGSLPGAHYGTPKRVFYLATEDSWKHTLVPRLIAAGADRDLIGRVDVATTEGGTVTLSLPHDTGLLTQEIIDNDVALVVVDPLMSTLGRGLDANGSRDVRTALEPLAAMADHTGAAVVGIAHFNKASGLDALSRITGSGAFKDIARAVMVFANDGDERVFTQPKNSVGRYDLPSLNYDIRSAVVDTPTGKASTGVFAFTGLADRSVDDLLADERQRKRPKSKVVQFLVDYITENADERGEVDAADVIAAGETEGLRRKQIVDARSRSKDPSFGTRKEGFAGEQQQTFWWIED